MKHGKIFCVSCVTFNLFSKEIIFISDKCYEIITIEAQKITMEHVNINNVYYNELIVFEPDGSNNPYLFCPFRYVTIGNATVNISAMQYSISFNCNYYEHDLFKAMSNKQCEFHYHHFMSHCKWIPTSVFYSYDPRMINQQIIIKNYNQLHHHSAICYCPNNASNCSINWLGPVYPGQTLKTDFCMCNSRKISSRCTDTQYTFANLKVAHQDQLLGSITTYTKTFNFTIVTEIQGHCELFLAASPCQYNIYEAFYVEILACLVGFMLQNGVCVCDPCLIYTNSNIHIDTCYIDQSTITHPANTWIVPAHYHSNNTKYLILHIVQCLPHPSHFNSDLQC